MTTRALHRYMSREETEYVLVAPSDAPDRVKNLAHFICDGVQDEVEINAAITENAGMIRLASGTFNISGSIAITDSDVILCGVGRATILKTEAAVTGSSFAVISGTAAVGLVVTDMTIDGNVDNQTHDTATHYGIRVVNSPRCLFQNLNVKNVGSSGSQTGYGIYMSNSSGCQVLDSQFAGCKRESVCCYNKSDYCVVANNVGEEAPDRDFVFHNVSNCVCKGNTSYAPTVSAINLLHDLGITRGENNVVMGNIVVQASGDGIDLQGQAFASVIGNTVEDANHCGISLVATHQSSVIGNVCRDCGRNGIDLAKYDYTTGSIEVTTGSATVTGTDTVWLDNMVGGLIKLDSGDTWYEIKSVTSTTLLTLQSNAADGGTGDYTLRMGSSYNSVVGNVCSNNGSGGGGYEQAIGVHTECYYNVIAGNGGYKGSIQTRGVRLFAGSKYNFVLGNMLTKLGSSAALQDVSGDNIIRQNEGWVTEASGSGTTNASGDEVEVSHGLSAAPTNVILSCVSDGANPYQSQAPDATKIYVTAVASKSWNWRAWVT